MRILCWNVCGDNDDQKLKELTSILEHWEEADPVCIICLQELSKNGIICKYFNEQEGWNVLEESEQVNGGGRKMAIIYRTDIELAVSNRVNLSKFWDSQGITSKPGRCPMYAVFSYGGNQICVFNWHATLGSRQMEDFVNLSQILDGQLDCSSIDENINTILENEMSIVIAADFNQTSEVMSGAFYKGFMGISNNIDHIIGRGIEISDGMHGGVSCSDHVPLTAHIE
ncbi:MAG: endonuclease/exonuclease/phosphatase family protein [Lachnospira sp.]